MAPKHFSRQGMFQTKLAAASGTVSRRTSVRVPPGWSAPRPACRACEDFGRRDAGAGRLWPRDRSDGFFSPMLQSTDLDHPENGGLKPP